MQRVTRQIAKMEDLESQSEFGFDSLGNGKPLKEARGVTYERKMVL